MSTKSIILVTSIEYVSHIQLQNSHYYYNPQPGQQALLITTSIRLKQMTFRSLQMSQYQMIIPRDSAYITINYLGFEDAFHLTDTSDVSNRTFTEILKRCDQCLLKINTIIRAIKEQKLQFEEYDQNESNFVESMRQFWRDQAKTKGIQQIKLLDLYQEKVIQQYRRYLELSNRFEKLTQNRKQTLEKLACLETLNQFMGDTRPKRDNQEYYIKNISQVSDIQSVSFMLGVISNELQWKVSKMIYRVSRGYACTKTLSQFKFYGLKNFDKKVILVIYPSSHNLTLEKRLHRILQTFCENQFLEHELEYTAKQEYEKTLTQYNEISNLVELGQREYKDFLQTVIKMSNIETWRLFFWKQRAVYQNLNKLTRREQFYIANIYIARKQLTRVSLLVNRISPTPTLHETPLEYPPTAFNSNDYTFIAQEITDTYGVPRYQQINPSIFTTITFPFFFGVMFGDIIHGIMIFALGLYAIKNKTTLQTNSMLKILAKMRYMITLMGFFAIYCGFVYNDLAGFNYNFFGSCYDPPMHAASQSEQQKQSRAIHPRPNCVYPFGIDPVWGRAQNELVFVNSLKMKISVIIAIIHMTLGVCCKAANSLYFKKKLDFYLEFIPQLIFLVILFGYMDFLIIFKWLKPWDEKVGTIPPQQWAPSIISTMMNVGLALGKTSTIPDGNSNMWGQRGHSSQDTIQLVILLVAFVCVPVMLLPKPYIQIRRKNKHKVVKANPLGLQDDLIEQSRNALEQKLNPKSQSQHHGHQKQEQNSQIIVHQLIETIEFVLGTVSNTASYLRLWALSLAHSQLSKVFFQQTAGRFIGSNIFIEIPSLFVGTWIVMWITFGIIICMDSMECFLHALRLHWVEFQNKFYKGDGYRYQAISFKNEILKLKQEK